MLPKVDYLNTRDVLSRQRDVSIHAPSEMVVLMPLAFIQAIMAKIRTMSKSRTIYSGLKQFKTASAGLKIDFKDVPGLREYGRAGSSAINLMLCCDI